MNILNIHYRFLYYRNYVYAPSSAFLNISSTASLRNVKIYLSPGTKLVVSDGVDIRNAVICVEKGECIIHDNCIIGSPSKGGGSDY